MAGVKSRKATDLRASSELVQSALRTLETEAAGLAALSVAINNGLGEALTAAVEKIRAANGRVIVTGMGKSGHIGRKIAATLASTGTPAYFVHPGEASHGDLGMITRDDVIVALSWSGETGELRDLIEYAKRFRVALIAFTSNAKSTLADAADVVLLLPQATEACPLGLAPTTSTLIQLALGDALAVALFESHGFTALKFRELHPGGQLGALLRFVRDIMHKDERLPIASLGTPMSEAVLEMSAKGFGCIGIVDGAGSLAGIITDGDLRRHMRSDLLTQRVEDIMTKQPVTATADQLASEALEMMNSANKGKGITALFVVEAGKPVGLVHMQDLLRIGVA